MKKNENIYVAVPQSGKAYYFATGGSIDWENYSAEYERTPLIVGKDKVVPFGNDNNIPDEICSVLSRNNLAPGILEREIGLVWGLGPRLYQEEYCDGFINRKWIIDTSIQSWLNSWQSNKFIRNCLSEFKYMRGFFVKFIKTKGSLLGNNSIALLEYIPNYKARLGYADSLCESDVQHVYIGNWQDKKDITKYPRFSKKPESLVSAEYYSGWTFGQGFYSLPSYWGALEWIERSSDIPRIIKSLTDNSISAVYHVHSPEEYWLKKMDEIQQAHPDSTEKQIIEELRKVKDETFNNLTDALSGKKNTGKFFETVDFADGAGNMQSWKIEAIDQKIESLIKAHLAVSEKADSATTSGIGLPPCLANVIINGQLSSGSQLIYAYKLYLASDVNLVEQIVFEPINEAIKYNFPKSNVKMGFYREIVKTEDSVSSADRIKNNI